MPQPQSQKRVPQFDLTVIESLDTWRKAMRRAMATERALKSAVTPTDRGVASSNRIRAYGALADARSGFEEMLRASVEGEE